MRSAHITAIIAMLTRTTQYSVVFRLLITAISALWRAALAYRRWFAPPTAGDARRPMRCAERTEHARRTRTDASGRSAAQDLTKCVEHFKAVLCHLRQRMQIHCNATVRVLQVALLAIAVCAAEGCTKIPAVNGFCVRQLRYLSDDEYLVIAIRRLQQRLEIDDSDSSIRGFLETHPLCCRVNRNPNYDVASFGSLLELYVVEVELNYKVPDDLREQLGPYYHSVLRIRPCGQVVQWLGSSRDALQIVGK